MASRLQALRVRAGLSQTQLAAKADVPIGSLRSWEQARRSLFLETAVKLARALGVSLDELAGVEAPARPKGRKRKS